MQDCSISIANALELLQSCTEPLILIRACRCGMEHLKNWHWMYVYKQTIWDKCLCRKFSTGSCSPDTADISHEYSVGCSREKIGHFRGQSCLFSISILWIITRNDENLLVVIFPISKSFWIIFSCDQAALQMVFSVCPSVRLSVCLSHLFDYVPIIVSSWNFQGLLPMTKVRSMQKVKVRGQRSRSQRSQPNLTVSGL